MLQAYYKRMIFSGITAVKCGALWFSVICMSYPLLTTTAQNLHQRNEKKTYEVLKTS